MEIPVVAIVGGGLAAVSAALTLKGEGVHPIIFERSNSLGGRAGSHTDRKGRLLDVGQHVYLGCCTEFRALLRRLGTEELAPLERRLDFALVDASTRRTAYLRSAPLPYPFSLIAGILGYSHLSLAERAHTIRLVRKAVRDFSTRRAEQQTFAEWLIRRQASPQSIELLWEPLILATLNATTAEVSAHSALMVIAGGLAGGSESAAVGIPRAPLSSLLAPVSSVLGREGDVRLSANVHAVNLQGGEAVSVVVGSGVEISCDAVIVATSHYDVPRLLSDPWRAHPHFSTLAEIGTGAIVNIHLWYDAPILPRPMVGVLRSPLQWLFDLTTLHDEHPDGGYHIAISLSGADDLMTIPARELQSACASELERIFPAAGRAQLLEGAARKMSRATFACGPRDEERRPNNRTPVRRLYLAGDYTQTGWPSTMESAVRSGRIAAQCVMADLL